MNLVGQRIRLLPYSKTDWEHIARWFHDPDYSEMFRHFKYPLTKEDFENYPQLCGGQVFLINNKASGEVIGLCEIRPDSKNNQAFQVGLIIDKAHQKQQYPLECFIVLFNYAFNHLKYRKAIIEVVATNASLNKAISAGGFLYEGKLLQECFCDGEYVDELRYCMFSSFYNRKYKEVLKSWVAY